MQGEACIRARPEEKENREGRREGKDGPKRPHEVMVLICWGSKNLSSRGESAKGVVL